MTPVDDTQIGIYLRESREKRGITARRVAEEIGLDPSAYSRVETGTRKLTAGELVRAADTLGMSVDDLVHRRDGAQVESWRLAQAGVVDALSSLTTLILRLDRMDSVDAGTITRLIPEPPTSVGVRAGRGELLRDALTQLAASINIVEVQRYSEGKPRPLGEPV